ncbi:uncharacterized protein [Oscarella lobularis]|uniref:uncharacterized protein n=1 Tax=Oscarella lobularis TaxID=121494 RepID=UPI003313CA84
MASWTLLYLLCRLVVGGACGDPETNRESSATTIKTDDVAADRVFKTLDAIRMPLTERERRTLRESIARDRANGRAPQTMRPLVIIPAFASSRLRVWQTSGCRDGLTNFKIGGDSWLDLAMYFSARRCWLDCVELDPVTQDDTPTCKSRADEGLDAVTELSPGFITGPLSSVWKSFIDMAASLGYEPHRTMVAAPYDFRLAPSLLETRDGYFSRLKYTIEHAVRQAEKNGDFDDDGSAVIVAHSLGNVIFHYFTEWLKADLGLFHYRAWLDEYVHTLIAAAPPVLGSTEALQGLLSGITFGLPAFPMHEARHLGSTFSSSHLMTPHPPNAADDNYRATNPVVRRVPLLRVDIPETGKTYDFDANAVRNGHVFRRLGRYDALMNETAEQLLRFYDRDPLADVLHKPWPRPPVKRVICAYGVGVSTTLALKLRKSEVVVPADDGGGGHERVVTWDAYDILTEEGVPRKLRWSSGASADDAAERVRDGVQKSGDGTVPYESLSWCHTWLGRRVNVTRVPQERHYGDDDVERFVDVAVNHTLPPKPDSSRQYNVFYEHARWDDQRRLEETSVWELESIPHRGLMESESVLQLVKTELLSSHLQHLSFRELKREMADREQVAGLQARTESRGSAKPPSVDDECVWDYGRAECKWSKYCVYDYRFGDLHLSQSCRLRKKNGDAEEKTEKKTAEKLPRCKCVDDQCMSGFCKYEGRCEQAVRAFGPSNGWWGPCGTAEGFIEKNIEKDSQHRNEL